MRNPIVVGIDPSHADDAPIALAKGLARALDAPLIAASAYLQGHGAAGVPDGAARDAAIERLAARVADGDAELMAGVGSSAAHVLSDVAEQRDAALLVVGSTRRGALGRVFPGSTAERLLHGSTCAVAVAPAGLAPDWAPRELVAGFVDTTDARAALATAAALARATGARLRIVSAVEPLEWSRSAVVQPYLAGAGPEAAVDLAARALERAARALDLDPPAETEVVSGTPVDVLAAHSRASDLVICGSRGYGALHSVLLGGVTHALVRRSAGPVLVVPRGSSGMVGALSASAAVAAS
jgi:nucleotide-binding universal stress UspA family protein